MSRRPNFGGMGMGGMNMQQMMKQAKKLQAQMAEEQENITAQEFTGRSADEFDDRSLVALSTLYGIELMEDNVKMLVMNMFSQFSFDYQSGIK